MIDIKEIDNREWDPDIYHAAPRKRVYAKAFNVYGTERQRMVAIEEMAELTKELCKIQRDGTTMDKLVDEITDVKIMVEQLVLMFDCKDEVYHRMRQKIDRLIKRMEVVDAEP